MLFERYKEQELIWQTTVNAPTSEGGKHAFRGDLVVTLGKMHEASQTRNPPEVVFHGANILADEDKWSFVGGALDRIDQIPIWFERFGADLADDAIVILYVVNASKEMKTDYEGRTIYIRTFAENVTWQLLMEDLYVEKSDMKGQSPADKLITMADAAKDFSPKCPAVGFDEALGLTADVVREVHGAV